MDMLSKQLCEMIEKFTEENSELSTEEVVARLNAMYMVEVPWMEWF